MTGGLSFEPLTRFTPLESFICRGRPGCDDLEEFLKQEALTAQNNNIAKVTLAYIDELLIGYYALSSGTIQLQAEDKEELSLDSHRYMTFPAALLSRLAVHSDYWSKAYGRILLARAISQVLEASRYLGIRFLIAHAYDHRVSWYEKNGFKKIKSLGDGNPPLVLMRFDLFPGEQRDKASQKLSRQAC